MIVKVDLTKAKLLCVCPFCGLRVFEHYDDNNELDGLIHEMPFCSRFERLEVGDFTRAMREKMTGGPS